MSKTIFTWMHQIPESHAQLPHLGYEDKSPFWPYIVLMVVECILIGLILWGVLR